MSISVVLLSSDGFYCGPTGELPKRPEFDKALITALATDATVLCSRNTSITLPKSIVSVAKRVTTDPTSDWDVNFGISTFSHLAEFFMIVYSAEPLKNGKAFDMTRVVENYRFLYNDNKITLWKRRIKSH